MNQEPGGRTIGYCVVGSRFEGDEFVGRCDTHDWTGPPHFGWQGQKLADGDTLVHVADNYTRDPGCTAGATKE